MSFADNIRGLFRRSVGSGINAVFLGSNDSVNLGDRSPEVASKISAVYSAVKLISESVAKLPLEVKRWNSVQKCHVLDYYNPLYHILNLCPNSRMSAYDLVVNAVRQVLLEGNAYLYPTRNALGDVDSIVLLSPYCVSHDKLSNMYIINDAWYGITETVTASEIIHIRNVSFDGGKSGMSTIHQAAIALGIASAADVEVADLFGSGSRQRGIITGESQASAGFGAAQEKQLKVTRDRIAEELSRGGKITYLSGSMKFQPFSMTPADVQMLDNRKFTVKEIGRFFRVQPSLLYEDGGSSYSNAEYDQLTFVNNTIEPLLRQIEQELNIKLLSPEQRKYTRIQFNREPLYIISLETKMNYIKQTIECGVMTVNEWRKKEGRPMVDGGDSVLVSANVMTLSQRISEATDKRSLRQEPPKPVQAAVTVKESEDTDNEEDEG